MTSRKLDLVVERINEQNELDANQLLKETQINTRLVNHLNNNREKLHVKTNFRERRFQEGLIRNELMRLDKVSTTKNQRGNTIDTKMNTYRHQNFLLSPKNKDNIFNYIDNLNYVLDKNENYRYNYHKTMINNMNFYNFRKDRYFANIHDKFYNNNNDKKWMSNDIIFFLNRAVNDEIKEDKDYKEAHKLNRYMDYLNNKRNENLSYSQNFLNKHIEAKTRYNDYFLEKDDILNKKVNELRDINNNNSYNEDDRDYYHKIIIGKEELDKRHKNEEKKRKQRENKIKMMEDERLQRAQEILEKENNKFKFANKKENNCFISKKNAELETEKIREDLEKKAKEVEIRNDRIFKNQTVYKKGIYEMPLTNSL